MSTSRGFTLIEVLVALAIVAIGMSAVLEALTSSANTAVYLQDKTFAEWAALNRIETVRLSGNVPATGDSNDNLDYAGRSWEWRQRVTGTQIPGLVKIQIDVRPANSNASDNRGWYASAIGFMSNAMAPPTDQAPPWSQQPINTVPAPNAPGLQPGQQPGIPGSPGTQ